ncbi:hypothetical protein NMK54_35440 [Nocardia otitidiscaviarum]|uniref:hypothetical protein n=1 Tax=Nocardia otitidiscaviarum TaxID=1823 RepID=UPI001FD15220|nr:hypothetical protein [Nocardia otitidiscaviarum]MCP9625439.1 hypothetical protein [Nocardia otitidiscaviarum]
MTDVVGELTAAHPFVRALGAAGPAGWERMTAVFALTTTAEIGDLCYTVGEKTVSVSPPELVLVHARELRTRAATSGAGPWWRMLVSMNASGAPEVDYDYGAEPFVEAHALGPEAIRADLREFPRPTVPVWLAAFAGHGDRQRRGPRQAAEQARADRESEVWAVLAENEFPPFPLLWSRWATLAAAFVAVGSPRGPRMVPWTGVFEAATRGGSTLTALPAGRAVLSGGLWNDPTLSAVYNHGAPMPDLYAGAPEWVAEPALNSRATTGLLSFCYWWESGRWYRGQSPSAARCADAVPGMWTADTVADIVTRLSSAGSSDAGSDRPDRAVREAVATLIAAAELGAVTRDLLTALFGDDGRCDIDGAYYQYSAAGLVSTVPEPMPSGQAISRVRDYVTGPGSDTAGDFLSELVAERFEVGWMVYAPVSDKPIAADRTIFYLADDGVLEHSSSAITPADYIAEFADRYAARQGRVPNG